MWRMLGRIVSWKKVRGRATYIVIIRCCVLFVLHERYKTMALLVQTKVHEVGDRVDFGQPSSSQHLVVLRMEKHIIPVYAYNVFGEAIPEAVNSGLLQWGRS